MIQQPETSPGDLKTVGPDASVLRAECVRSGAIASVGVGKLADKLLEDGWRLRISWNDLFDVRDEFWSTK